MIRKFEFIVVLTGSSKNFEFDKREVAISEGTIDIS